MKHRWPAFVSFGLALVTVALYWPVRHHDFVIYDDGIYVTQNRFVQSGLTVESLKWAFGGVASEGTYWHPISWLSHMVDCQLFGSNAGAHHLANVLFHIANAILLLFVLKRMTGAIWPSILAASLFALHPLQVETVAWIAERKNVLSTLFMLLTILAYARYTEERKRGSPRARVFYIVTVVIYAVGLMCKPMLVTLPCVLLLLDFWPLNRVVGANAITSITPESVRALLPRLLRLMGEKVPMFVLAAISCVITIQAHKKLGILMPDAPQFSLGARLANSVVSYVRYLGKIFWPADLAVYYPLPSHWPFFIVTSAVLILIAITFMTFLIARKKPAILVGWLWFLGTLVPVIGIVQANDQAMANRFAYVPIIGIFVMLSWAAVDLAERIAARRVTTGAALAIVFGACFAVSSSQLTHWKDSEALFTYATETTSDNNVAYLNLGVVCEAQGRLTDAEAYYTRSLQIQPTNAMAHSNLGVVFGRQGRLDDAIRCFQRAIIINPEHADAHSNLGMAFMQQRNYEAAATNLVRALQLKPNHPQAHFNLANVFAERRQFEESEKHFATVLQLQPNNTDARNNFARVLLSRNKTAEAVAEFERVLRINPDHANAHLNLGQILQSQGKQTEAATHFAAVQRLRPELLGSLRESGPPSR